MKAVIGVCISEAQGAIDWQVLRQKVSFVYLVTAAGEKPDANLDANFNAAVQAGLPVGLIHLMQIFHIKLWKTQNTAIINAVKKYKTNLPPILDLQFDGDLTKNELNNVGAKFTKFFEKGTLKKLGFRTNAAFFNKHYPLTDWAKYRYLWVVDPGVATPAVPKEWSKRKPQWIYWTYNASENNLGPQLGLSSPHAELLRFYGDASRLKKTFSLQVTEVEEITA
jgi:GH25 family lysozyme M1 (1,4-beta-N-acetylmuramidase)